MGNRFKNLVTNNQKTKIMLRINNKFNQTILNYNNFNNKLVKPILKMLEIQAVIAAVQNQKPRVKNFILSKNLFLP
jgi:hypothetical protein